MEFKRAEFIIHGRVQGVGYRYFVYTHAIKLGLHGYASNQWDGTVFVVAEGDRIQIDILKGYLEKGPSLARVSGIDFTISEFTGEFSNFNIH